MLPLIPNLKRHSGLVPESILFISIIAGQLIKLPIAKEGGATFLDITVLILCLIGLIKSKFKLPKPNRLILSAIPFVLIATISLIFSPIGLTNTERLTSFFYTVRFGAFLVLGYLINQNVIPAKAGIHKTLTLSGLILAILGLIQFIFIPDLGFLASQGWDPHYFRTASTFLDPNFLGGYMALTLLLLFERSENFSTTSRRIILGLVFLTLLTTFSRGAYLAFFTSFMVLSLARKSIKLAIATLLLSIGLLIGFFTYQHLIATPRGIDRTQSAEYRLDTWQQGLIMFSKNPILGVGFNTYRFALSQYNLADTGFIKSHGASSNDSSLLFVAATTGIIGLLAYLYWLGNLAWFGFRKNPILLAGLAGLIAQSFFANTLFYPFLLLWLVLV